MPKGAVRFKSMTVGKQQGELARFRVLGGPDNGVVFVITAARVTIGRGEDNDVILSDPKTSRKHAELALSGGAMVLTDLGSSHGFMVNGFSQKQAALKNGDKVGMGETVLEYIGGVNVGATQLLIRPPVQTVKKVGGGSGLTRFIPRPAEQAASQAGKASEGFIDKNKRLFLGLGFLIMLSAALPEVETRVRRQPTVYQTSADPASLTGNAANQALQVDKDSPQYKNADNWYHQGMREYYSKNYRRALEDFQTATEIDGGHPLAKVYIETTKKEMGEEADERFRLAKKELDANRFKNAMNHYAYVKRLYEADQSHDNYKKADEAAKDLQKKMDEMEKE